MKFLSYDSKKSEECQTDIKIADQDSITLFVQQWFAFAFFQKLRDPNFKYSLFPWDKIIKKSLHLPEIETYCAYTEGMLDGMVCIKPDATTKIEYIATAPWNYYEIGYRRRIGTGLICYTCLYCKKNGLNDGILLNALADAEPFYQKIGMTKTGNKNKAGLNEYYMPKKKSDSLINSFNRYIISDEINGGE